MTSLCLFWIGLVIVGYLCGSVPFGLIIGLLKGVDIRTRGSGNIGATNAGRVLGRAYGVLAFILDVLKGWLPVAAFGYWSRRAGGPGPLAHDPGTCLMWMMVGASCILGHMFPIYLKFRGGKGVATSLGVVLGIYPYYLWPGLAALGLWVVVTLLTRYVSVGSMIAALVFPIMFIVVAQARAEAWGGVGQLWPLYGFAIVVPLLVVYRHRSNLRRLLAGTESRIGDAGHTLE